MRAWALFACTAFILIGGPLLGVWLAGKPVAAYLEFPPRPVAIQQPFFSWTAFATMLVFIVVTVAPFAVRFLRAPNFTRPCTPGPLPAWGWAALALVVVSWLLAWTRFNGFEPFQWHTFTPLWIGYIGVVNALVVRRKGSSLLTRQPARYMMLFPVSALFWWFFEYLNRFVGNWHYVAVADFGPLGYVLFATLSFSTVLPAVTSTAELLATFTKFRNAFAHWRSLQIKHPKAAAGMVLTATALSLVLLGVIPDLLYPLVWVSPALILMSLQSLAGRATVLAPLKIGDWRVFVSFAGAALLCGFFWELWNSGSLAHWEYAVPYVGRFRIFEMPLLGYAGYLPFGIECAAISWLVLREESADSAA
jgi:hypothetical protein